MGDESLENKDKKKRALVIIQGPYTLLQFLWYYCVYGNGYTWTCMLHYFSENKKRKTLELMCRNSGIFEEIIYKDVSYKNFSVISKIRLFLSMMVYYVFGQRKRLCKKIVKENIDGRQFDLYVVPGDYQVFSGALISLSNELRVEILEDGAGDYLRHRKFLDLRKLSIIEISNWLVAVMGYGNPSYYYELRDTKNCTKFNSIPEKLTYKNYKQIIKLFDAVRDENEYKTLLKKVFFSDYEEKYNLSAYDVIFFTTALDEYAFEKGKYEGKAAVFLDNSFSSMRILIKRHPRDFYEYVTYNNYTDDFIDNNVPAEVLITFIKNKKIVMMYPSTLLLSLNCDVTIIYFLELAKESKRYKAEFWDVINAFNIDKSKIVEIS